MMNTISARALKERLDAGEGLKLVNALEESKFKLSHIEGSLNIYRKEDIEKWLAKTDHIVVYCTDTACNKSIMLYQLLEALGYPNVIRFSGGLKEWDEAGFPLVSS